MTGTRFGIGSTINYPRNSGLHDRAGAHGTWLKRDVQRAIQQSPRFQNFCRLRDRNHFRMRRGIVQHLTLIAGFGDDFFFLQLRVPPRTRLPGGKHAGLDGFALGCKRGAVGGAGQLRDSGVRIGDAPSGRHDG